MAVLRKRMLFCWMGRTDTMIDHSRGWWFKSICKKCAVRVLFHQKKKRAETCYNVQKKPGKLIYLKAERDNKMEVAAHPRLSLSPALSVSLQPGCPPDLEFVLRVSPMDLFESEERRDRQQGSESNLRLCHRQSVTDDWKAVLLWKYRSSYTEGLALPNNFLKCGERECLNISRRDPRDDRTS
jgi:hypothetical protein